MQAVSIKATTTPWCVAIIMVTALAGCAGSGYHYRAGDFFTQTPNDACWRDEVFSPGMVKWLNSSVGKPRGVPGQVVAVSAPAGFDRAWFSGMNVMYRSSAELACHATLTLAAGGKVSGLFFIDDLGSYDNGVDKGLSVGWISDEAITALMVRAGRLPPGSTTYFPSNAIGPARR